MSGRTRAIVVGVDDYSFRPLSSAVNDAVAFRDALVKPLEGEQAGLVDPGDVSLFVSPVAGESTPAGAQPATRRAIEVALKRYYTGELQADRLIFYFAGHGMTATSEERGGRESIILPADVESTDEGRNMLCLDQLLRLFSERGPVQQLWVVDACRNMPYEKRPRGYGLSWTDEAPQGLRAQVAIFAVAPGGEAPAARGGQGQFTSHIINGLRGDGCAADYVLGTGYGVTAQSLHEYAAKRIEEGLQGWNEWTRSIQSPDIRPSGPTLPPLRKLKNPQPREFVVNVRPPEAVGVVDVALEVQTGIRVAEWPSRAPPRRYELKAILLPGMDLEGWGQPTPDSRIVDLREEATATIDVPRADPDGSGTRSVELNHGQSEPHGTFQIISTVAVDGRSDPTKAYLNVRAADEPTRILARRIEYPWTEKKCILPNTDQDLEPGVWEVQAVIGNEVLSAGRVLLSPGQLRTLSLQAQVTPVLAELLPPSAFQSRVAKTVMPSESIGPMQTVILPTLLPLLAIKPYDYSNQVLRQFDHLGIPIAPLHGPWPPLRQVSVAVAVERGIEEERDLPRVELGRQVWSSPEGRMSIHQFGGSAGNGTVSIQLQRCRANIAAPTLDRGVTAIGLIVRPDGRVQSSIGVFHDPLGTPWPQKYGDGSSLKPERISRAIALAAPLYRAGADLRRYDRRFLSEFAEAKWLDPVMGALAFHSCRRQLSSIQQRERTDTEGLRRLYKIIQMNMTVYFGELPDSRVIGAMHEDVDQRLEAMALLLNDESLGHPALSASVFALADTALRLGLMDHWAIDRSDRIEPGEVFNLVVTTQKGE